MKLRIKFSNDIAYYILISMVWCHTIILSFAHAAISKLPIVGEASDFVILFIYIVMILLSCIMGEFKFYNIDIVVAILIVSIYVLSPIVHPNTFAFWKEQHIRFLFYVFPSYFIGMVIIKKDETDKIFQLLYLLSLISIYVYVVYSIYQRKAHPFRIYYDQMVDSYNLLPHICLIVYQTIKNRKLINIATSILGIFLLFLLGTRGPILCLFVCIVLMVSLLAQWKQKLIIFLLFMVIIGFILSPLFVQILGEMSDFSDRWNFSSRIFSQLKSGQILDSSGRDYIAERLYSALADSPFWGFGIYGDFLFVNTYAHKLYLELWVHYGYIIGTVFLLAFVAIPIAGYLKTDNKNEKAMVVILYCSSIVKLFLSGSYLHQSLLYFLLGFSIALMKRKKKKRLRLECGKEHAVLSAG